MAQGVSPSRRVLIVAYYFPPMGLSGVQRVAKLVKYLPRHGWQPLVLTARPAGYFAFDDALLAEVEAAGAEIYRTRSLDPTRLFGRGSTVSLPAEGRRRLLTLASQLVFVPDNKIGWLPFAVREGLRIHRARGFDAVLSSAPPYTGHLIGALLARATGTPLLLDYRDDWTGNPRHVYPTPLHRGLNLALERWALRSAGHVTAINGYIADALRRRQPKGTFEVLPQGYDAEDFDVAPAAVDDRPFRLLYSGVFYDAQTPDVFLKGLARFLDRVPSARAQTEARFVGLFPAASEALVEELGLREVVRLTGYQPHRETVAELKAAAVLWMTIGARPGAAGISTSKLFEYMGARKPILALVPDGAAREALGPYHAAELVPPDAPDDVAAALGRLYEAWRRASLPAPEEDYVRSFERARLARRVASRLDDLTNDRRPSLHALEDA